MLARRIQDFGEDDITGIAVTDKSALCIEADLTATAYGMATVTILYPKNRSYIECTANQSLTFTNIGFDQLIPGVTYDLKTHQLVDPGSDLQQISFTPETPTFVDTVLQGSSTASADFGEIVITNIYGDDLNAWYGYLGQTAGNAVLPNTIIIPRIWELDTEEDNPRLYFENRSIGGMYGLVGHPNFITIYVDNTSTISVYENGEIESDGLMYILDLKHATHAGFTSTRNTDFPGIIGAELHFLGAGQRYNLLTHSPVTTINHQSPALPSKTHLYGLYPNPFNPRTTIQYNVAKKGPVRIEIYDSIGSKLSTLTDQIHTPGLYRVSWQPAELSSGIYFVRLMTADDVQIRKAVLLK
jgi:hypothetical protein